MGHPDTDIHTYVQENNADFSAHHAMQMIGSAEWKLAIRQTAKWIGEPTQGRSQQASTGAAAIVAATDEEFQWAFRPFHGSGGWPVGLAEQESQTRWTLKEASLGEQMCRTWRTSLLAMLHQRVQWALS